MDMEAYKRMLGTKTSSEALVNTSIKQTMSMFKESPLFQVIKVDGKDKGVRVSYEKEYERQILLQPKDNTFKGSIAEFDGRSWIVTEFIQDLVYPKAKVQFCNQTLKWKDNSGDINELPCSVRSSTFTLNEEDESVKLQDGKISVIAPYNDLTKLINVSQRFIFEDEAYQVISVDKISSKNTQAVDKVNNIDYRKLDENIFKMPNDSFEYIDIETGWLKGNSNSPLKIKVLPSTKHTLSLTTKPTNYTKESIISGELCIYDDNGVKTRTLWFNSSFVNEERNHLTFTTRDNEASVSFNGYHPTHLYSRFYKDIMLNVGDIIPYKPYDSQITTGLIEMQMEAVSIGENDNKVIDIGDTNTSGSGWGGGW